MILWYPAATRIPGPVANVYPDANRVAGLINHSSEGHWSNVYGPIDTMIQRGVSWPFSVFRDGHVEQHYPLNASCWHAGSRGWNVRVVGVEHEGVNGEPLTAAQLVASVTLSRWVAKQGGWPMDRIAGPTRTLWEHREVAQTDCPNGRIPWGYYYEENDVAVFNKSDDQVQAITQFITEIRGAPEAIAAQDGSGVFVYQSGSLKDEAGNVIAIPAGKVGTLLVHDA